MKDEGRVNDNGHRPGRDDRCDDDDVAQVRKSSTELDCATTKENATGDGGDEDQWEPLSAKMADPSRNGRKRGDRPTSSTEKKDDDGGEEGSHSKTTIIDTVPSPAALRGHWERWEREGSSSRSSSSGRLPFPATAARVGTTDHRNGGAAGAGGGGLGDVRVLSAYRHPRSHKITFGPSNKSSSNRKKSSMWTPVLVLVSFLSLMLLLSLTAFRDVGGDLGGATSARAEFKKRRAEMEREEEYLKKRGDVGCGLYLSRSSVAWGRTGLWGVFAARKFEAGDVLFEPGISIRLLGDGDDPGAYDDEEVLTHLRVAGEITVMRGDTSSNGNSISTSATTVDGTMIFLPHLAMLVQPHPTLHNVERRHVIDTASAQRSGGVAVVATRPISPGEEIFLDADYDAVTDDLYRIASVAEVEGNSSSAVAFAPLAEHYRRADEIATDAMGLAGNPNARGRRRRENKVDGSYLKVLKRTVALYDPATASLLPETHDELMEISRRRGVGVVGGDVGVGTALASLSNRSLSWLDRHGRCIDNVRPGDDGASDATATATTPSTEEEGADAECRVGPPAARGRPGVFTARFIPRGGLVTTAPVYVIADGRTEEGMTTASDDEEEEAGRRRKRRKPWLQHCFGHGDSSAVICPSSYAVLINGEGSSPAARGECKACDDDDRSSTGEKGRRFEEEVRPNTKYEWSAWNKDNIKHIGRRLTEGEVVQGMSLDFIATRDISPGEEIFIDHGEEWHSAQKEFSSTCCTPGETSNLCRSFRRQMQMKDSVFPARWKVIQ